MADVINSPIAKKDQLRNITASPGAQLRVDPPIPRSMSCLGSYLTNFICSLVEPYSFYLTAERAQLIGIALVSWAAIHVGYCYILSCKEAALAFNVLLPSEVRNSSGGKKWDEVQGQEKRVLEDQARGVSVTRRLAAPLANRWF